MAHLRLFGLDAHVVEDNSGVRHPERFAAALELELDPCVPLAFVLDESSRGKHRFGHREIDLGRRQRPW